MKARALRTVGKAAMERITGGKPGPVRAALASAVTGGATAAVTYKLLRSGGGDSDDSDSDDD
jgi:hypothetical protein